MTLREIPSNCGNLPNSALHIRCFPMQDSAALRLMVLALTGLMALPLTGSAPQQPNYVDLNKSRLIIVKIPAGTFRMGSDLIIHADDGWKPCATCSPRNEVERPFTRSPSAKTSGWESSTSLRSSGR